MFLSIIIPTFNRASLIRTTIDSILDQRLDDVEIIIVDDGSQDDTETVVKQIEAPQVKYVRITNRERGAARNVGLTHASGKYINYFDSDDLYLPCLIPLRRFTKMQGFPPVIYGEIHQANGDISSSLPYTSFSRNLLHNNFLACGSVFLKREVALMFNFNEDRRLSSAEDWELWLRVHVQYDFTFFPDRIFKQVQHAGRSLAVILPDRIEARDNYLASLVADDQGMQQRYGQRAMDLFRADRYTFIALAFAGHDPKKTFLYWKKSFASTFWILTRRRFWAVLKKLVIRSV